jgi:hypothetical protein
MRITTALVAVKRCNKFVILHQNGMLFHTSPNPRCSASAEPARHPRRQLRTPPSRSPETAMVRRKDGKLKGGGLFFTPSAPPQLGMAL